MTDVNVHRLFEIKHELIRVECEHNGRIDDVILKPIICYYRFLLQISRKLVIFFGCIKHSLHAMISYSLAIIWVFWHRSKHVQKQCFFFIWLSAAGQWPSLIFLSQCVVLRIQHAATTAHFDIFLQSWNETKNKKTKTRQETASIVSVLQSGISREQEKFIWKTYIYI